MTDDELLAAIRAVIAESPFVGVPPRPTHTPSAGPTWCSVTSPRSGPTAVRGRLRLPALPGTGGGAYVFWSKGAAAVPRLSGVHDATLTHEQVDDAESGLVRPLEKSLASAVACRALDLSVGALALIVLSPLLLLIAIAIRLDSRGPALFRQERCGRDTKRFVVNKFRTMHTGTHNDEHVAFVQRLIAGDAERHENLFKLACDERVTRVGRILRKSSLDELPQLINVMFGQMSLVGPRPCLDYEVEKYPPHALLRFRVKPGITGLWQVSGRSQLSFEEMIALDLEYAERQSFRLNVWILLRTVPVVLLGRGAA